MWLVLGAGACWGRELMCILLEWVSKGALSELLEDSSLDWTWHDPLLRLALDVARGMAYLHGQVVLFLSCAKMNSTDERR
jgi:hypothetical protein